MKICVLFAACLGLMFAIGCTPETSTTSPPTSVSPLDGSKYLLGKEPEGAAGVIKVRQASQDGDDVLIVGRIGGGKVPWVEGLAAFSIVDASLKSCADIGSDDCPTPWDYC